MSSEYSDIQRGFLQVVMSRGTLSENSANKVLADLFAAENQNTPTEEDLQSVIDATNERIHIFDQRIDVVSSMYDDKTFVVMGVDCDGDTCNGRYHTSCITKFMAKNTKCPKCKKVWKSSEPQEITT